MMLTLINEHACFDGVQRFYSHHSSAIGLTMRFSVFIPAQALSATQTDTQSATQSAKVPALFYLAGLTCSEETFMTKAGAQRTAAELGMILIAPDTSPRDAAVAGETEHWDFGLAAGFYVDATEAPWSSHYRMYSYILELYDLVIDAFPVEPSRVGISGHSMGGHGALMLALRNPRLFSSVSAFAPICAPRLCPWGKKAFTGYLGSDEHNWLQYDASALMEKSTTPFPQGILIDQGLADKYLHDQLMPEAFTQACFKAKQPLTLRRHAGYDHYYYFVSTFIEDHLRFHAGQ